MSWLLWSLLIGLAVGWLGSLIVKGTGLGLLWNLIIGLIGGVLGGWVFGLLGLSMGDGIWGNLITAVVVAVLLLLIVNLIRGKK